MAGFQQVNIWRNLTLYDKKGGKEQIVTAPSQWFTEESASKLYPLGTKLVVEDMVFRYGHLCANADSCWRGRGMLNMGKQNAANHANGYIPIGAGTAATAGNTSLTLTLGRYDPVVDAYQAVANEFENGEVYLESSPWSGIVRGRIKYNDATSTTTKFYLKEGIIAATSATPNGKLHWNQYAHAGKPKTDSHCSRRCSIVGCLAVNGTVDYYVWLQTWGPYLGQYGQPAQPGEGPDARAVYFDRYGAFVQLGAGGASQYAGFSLPCTTDNDADGMNGWSPLVMLQISP